jgi:hypothetical protein
VSSPKQQLIANIIGGTILAAVVLGGFFMTYVVFSPWDTVPWERRAKFERWCRASSGCEPLVESSVDEFTACWQRCYERTEHRYQLTGQRDPDARIMAGEQ